MLAAAAILGLVAGALAVTFLEVPTHSLPSFLGHLPGILRHRKRYGEVAAVIAIVLLFLAVVGVMTRKLSAAISALARRIVGR
ncbi:MAG: hypothetical protein ACRD6W_01630 [Nitrososphaerales archaeon]